MAWTPYLEMLGRDEVGIQYVRHGRVCALASLLDQLHDSRRSNARKHQEASSGMRNNAKDEGNLVILKIDVYTCRYQHPL